MYAMCIEFQLTTVLSGIASNTPLASSTSLHFP
uniref:Uncharacterized protein n=1 Tax=Arundo donax TaxID=35708 RepID=A0A0A9GTU6_ARUDO